MSSSYSTSSRARSSSPSPFSHRKPHLSSSSSFSATRIVPRSSPSSVSSHFPRSLTPTRGRAPVVDDLLADHDARSGDTISVTVRFRPLSEREFQRGDEIAWYPDGETIVRSEYYPATAYAFDRVFGPATGSKDVYDVAAQPVVRAAMDGINGTVFAYGVTSSGKTHTMHGDHNSPGIIPLAIKDVFSMIQDTPGREFLLRVSYIEIYNEVINDLLDPTGQNLRVREDTQGTYVEGLKEEVVLSPGHALSFIASGEEHRHVGSNNFNLFSSRSHTIFTLMIESSAHGDDYDGVIFSQLNLIDLAGSESSKTETTGLRRKEGSYINKSLLTLGTVIGKLSEGRASHVPYRDSKLTRLLQSSLSGHGHVSLICTITPASSNTEETHNTLKFASRAKRVEISASRNRIIDEKSLIKKYQKEISTLKQELDQLKKGVLTELNHEEILSLRQKLEEGQVKMQSRLEEEEDAKAALMSRIQRLTKLILVSSKNSIPGCLGDIPAHQRHQSICDDDKSGLRDASPLILENGAQQDSESSDVKHQRSSSKSNDEQSSISSSVSEVNHGGENAHGYKITMAGMLTSDQVDLLSEQVKMLADEIGFSISSLKRLKEQSINDPEGSQIQIQNLENEIHEKQRQVRAIEQQLIDNNEASMANSSLKDLQQTVMKLTSQCNEKGFELELRTADNRILQEQLQKKCSENEKLQEKVCCLEQQLASAMGERSSSTPASSTEEIDALKRKVLSQDADNENLNLEKLRILEEYSGLQIQNQKLAEEASYAKELASAAAVELKNLAEEVTKLSLQNAIQAKELLAVQDMAYSRSASLQAGNGFPRKYSDSRFDGTMHGKRRPSSRGHERGGRIHDDNAYLSNELDEMKMELQSRKQREAALEGALREKELAEEENKRKYDEAKKREAALENELAGMWVLVAKLKKGDVGIQELNGHQRFGDGDLIGDQKENKYENNEIVINQKPLCDGSLKPNTDVHNTHSNMEPLLLRLKAQIQEMKEKKAEPLDNGDADSHLCKVCFEAPSADVLLPCRHFCLCRPCSLACSECPVCRTEIVDRIVTYTS